MYLETFTSMIECTQKNGSYENRLYDDMVCWSGEHIIHGTFAIGISLIFICISLIVSLTYFDSQSTSHNISARVNSRSEVFYIIVKIILIYVYAFVEYGEQQWLIIILMVILSFIGLYNYLYKWPYYNEKMNMYLVVLNGLFFWSNFSLFAAKVFEDTDFSGALQMFFLGIPLVIGVILFKLD